MNIFFILIFSGITSFVITLFQERNASITYIRAKTLFRMMYITPIFLICFIFIDIFINHFTFESKIGLFHLPVNFIITIFVTLLLFGLTDYIYKYFKNRGDFEYLENKPYKTEEQAKMRSFAKYSGLNYELYYAIIFFNVALFLAILFILFIYIPFCGNPFMNMVHEVGCVNKPN